MFSSKKYKPKPNDTCPCGSDKKFKKCCTNNSKYLSKKSPAQRLLSPHNSINVYKEDYIEPELKNKLKGQQGGLCNVTRCQSPNDVNYCNEWNCNTYYCVDCAVDFTQHDKSWTMGYRFNCMVPHPLLCSQKEVEWFINHNNTFCCEVEKREDGYWFNDFGQWYKVPESKRKYITVIDSHPMDAGTHILLRPEYHHAHRVQDVIFTLGDEGLVWDNETYKATTLSSRLRLNRGEIFKASTGEIIKVDYAL